MEKSKNIVFVVIIITISLAAILFFKIIISSNSDSENKVDNDVVEIDGLTYGDDEIEEENKTKK